jgi:hypothetical protein
LSRQRSAPPVATKKDSQKKGFNKRGALKGVKNNKTGGTVSESEMRISRLPSTLGPSKLQARAKSLRLNFIPINLIRSQSQQKIETLSMVKPKFFSRDYFFPSLDFRTAEEANWL